MDAEQRVSLRPTDDPEAEMAISDFPMAPIQIIDSIDNKIPFYLRIPLIRDLAYLAPIHRLGIIPAPKEHQRGPIITISHSLQDEEHIPLQPLIVDQQGQTQGG